MANIDRFEIGWTPLWGVILVLIILYYPQLTFIVKIVPWQIFFGNKHYMKAEQGQSLLDSVLVEHRYNSRQERSKQWTKKVWKVKCACRHRNLESLSSFTTSNTTWTLYREDELVKMMCESQVMPCDDIDFDKMSLVPTQSCHYQGKSILVNLSKIIRLMYICSVTFVSGIFP